jgi:flagellar biogenesis protein FliO
VTGSFTSSINHTEEIAAMSKSVEELHNHEDATSLMDGLRLFFGLIFILALLGVVFWSAF